MRITAWDIDRFGLWEGLSASGLSEYLNVFYGPNEAGKTTLMQFMRAMLYGFVGERRRYVKGPFPLFGAAAEARKRQLSDGDGASVGGAIDQLPGARTVTSDMPGITGGRMNVRSSLGPYHLKRQYNPVTTHGATTGDEDRFTITTPDGLYAGDKMLKQLTGEIDEQTFNNVFAIGLDELQQLGILEDTEAADLLYRLTIGIDRVSLLDAARALVQARNRLIDPHGKPGLIGRLVAQHAALNGKVAKARVRLREYGELLAEHRQHEHIANQIENEHRKLQRETRLFETAGLIAEIWDARAEVSREITRMGNVVPVDAGAVTLLNELRASIARQRDTLVRIKKEYGTLKTKHDSLAVNEELWKFTPRLEVVLEQEEWLRELGKQINVVKEEVRQFEKQLFDSGKNTGGLSPVATSDNADTDETDGERTTRRLRDYHVPAKALRTARQRYQQVKEEHRQYAEKNRILSEKIAGELSNRKIEDIAEALEKTGEMVNHLRRRQTLQQRYDEMVLYRKELDRMNAFLVQHQALPNWAIGVGLAGLALFGSLAVMPVFGLSDNYGYFVFGVLGVAGLIAAKVMIEKKNAQKLKTNQRQITMLASQMEHAKQEVSAIDARYPAHGKSTEMRLQAAQTELAALEKLVPLDGQMKEIAYHKETFETRLRKAKHGLQAAQKRWSVWLAAVGLPNDTQPSQVRELMGHYNEVGGLQRHYNLKVEELAMRQREMQMLTGQISRVALAAGITLPDDLTPLGLMERIRKMIADNEQRIKERDQLRKDLKKVNKSRRREKRAFDDFKKAKRELLEEYGVQHDEELRELAKIHTDYQARLEKQTQLQREIDAAIGEFCTEEEVAEILETSKRENLTELLEQVQERGELLSIELREQLEKRGRLVQQLAYIGNDRTNAAEQFELAMLENRISKHFAQWQVHGLATYVLEEIRTEYEQQRQPETLNEASRYFAAMTDGRYPRVWTPIGGNTLYVDDSEGNSFDVAWLSRGTREQLFVAIRLALATTFERHGISLPLVMDDVLVNFDTRRAYATAKTLLEFSQGGANSRQIFLFTCHDHICRMFHSLNVPVRILPSFADEQKQIRISMPRVKKAPEEIIEEPAVEQVMDEIIEPETAIIDKPVVETVEEPSKKPKRRKDKRKHKRSQEVNVVETAETVEIVEQPEPETVDDSEIDEAEEKPAADETAADLRAAETTTVAENTNEPEEPDDWAENFFDEYQDYHNSGVFDADFFDPVEEPSEESESVNSPYVEGFFDEEEE